MKEGFHKMHSEFSASTSDVSTSSGITADDPLLSKTPKEI